MGVWGCLWVLLMLPVLAVAQPEALHLNSLEFQMNQQVIKLLLDPNTAKLSQTPSEIQANCYFRHGNFAKAFPLALIWASLGSQRAALEVGFMYEFGRGVPQNQQSAAQWYYLVVDPNRYNIKPLLRGLNYYFGSNGYSQDYAKAAEWLRMAAELSYDRY